jgi:hypothetical protein
MLSWVATDEYRTRSLERQSSSLAVVGLKRESSSRYRETASDKQALQYSILHGLRMQCTGETDVTGSHIVHVSLKKLLKGLPRNTVLWIYTTNFKENLIFVRIGVLTNLIIKVPKQNMKLI